MPIGTQGHLIAALLFIALLTAIPIKPTPGAAPGAIDPPVFVTNLSGATVELQWQTFAPNTALSPVRGSSIAEDAASARANEGLFWFYDPAAEGPVENIVFVSIIGADGTILSQVVMEEEIAGTIEAIEETALHITIEADGTLELSVHDGD